MLDAKREAESSKQTEAETSAGKDVSVVPAPPVPPTVWHGIGYVLMGLAALGWAGLFLSTPLQGSNDCKFNLLVMECVEYSGNLRVETTVYPLVMLAFVLLGLRAVVAGIAIVVARMAQVARDRKNHTAANPWGRTAHTFNPPLGWPAAPLGWIPPKGWVEDPSWPEAPEDWQWWLPPGQQPAQPHDSRRA